MEKSPLRIGLSRVFNSFWMTESVVDYPIVNVLDLIIGVAVVVCIVMLVIAGIMYITSRGNHDKKRKARNILIVAVIGMCIIFLARILANFIFVTFVL